MNDVDPDRAQTTADYLLLLRQRRVVAGLSYRQLERRARHSGGSLPPSTVATMLRRSTLPGRDLVAAYVGACGGDAAEIAAWLTARARIAAAAVAPAPAAATPAGPTTTGWGSGALPAGAGGYGVLPPGAGRSGPFPPGQRGSGLFPPGQRGSGALPPGAGEHGPFPPGVPVVPNPPRQLPPAVSGLVGFRSQLAELDAVAGRTGSGLAIVTGPPGVGKTALAIHWAHHAEARFPDGQLYVDLRGHRPGARPLPTADALAYLLVGLGVPAAGVPTDEGQAAAVFRSLVADRRVLLVLDGAVSADQVRLLRPGGPRTHTVVTSRGSLVGLSVHDDGRAVRVDPLGRDHAVCLLARTAGEHLVAAEPGAARSLAALCDGLPLALRIAATAFDPGARAPIAGLVTRMRAEGRLAALDVRGDGCAGLEAAFGCSYDALDEAHRGLFRLVATLASTVVTVPLAAASAGLSLHAGRAALRRLADAHLLVRLTGDRYTVPGLLREYARRLPAGADADAGVGAGVAPDARKAPRLVLPGTGRPTTAAV
ncbi:NB-ARC domain-containing protein [Streptomyces sp. NPDC055078]